MRTPAEVIARVKEVERDDFFGTMRGDLVRALPFADAKPFLVEGTTPEEWEPYADDAAIKAEMAEYMAFALDKATGHRGLSAGRSIDHFRSWLWLLGDAETLAFANDEQNYAQYGMPILRRICERYGFPFPDDEDAQRMANGHPCGADYGCGCGA